MSYLKRILTRQVDQMARAARGRQRPPHLPHHKVTLTEFSRQVAFLGTLHGKQRAMATVVYDVLGLAIGAPRRPRHQARQRINAANRGCVDGRGRHRFEPNPGQRPAEGVVFETHLLNIFS